MHYLNWGMGIIIGTSVFLQKEWNYMLPVYKTFVEQQLQQITTRERKQEMKKILNMTYDLCSKMIPKTSNK